MVKNIRDEIEDTRRASIYLRYNMRSIKSKIAKYKVVKKVSNAAACISGVVSAIGILGSAGNGEYIDRAFYSLTEAQKAAAQASAQNDLVAGLLAGVATVGFVGLSYKVGKLIKLKEDDLHLTRVSWNNNVDKLKALKEEVSGQNLKYQRQEEYGSHTPLCLDAGQTESIEQPVIASSNEPNNQPLSKEDALRRAQFRKMVDATKDMFNEPSKTFDKGQVYELQDDNGREE